MKRRTLLMLVSGSFVFCTVIAASGVLLIWLYFKKPEVPQTENEGPIDEMLLATGVKLKFTRLYRDKDLFVTESPISNAQYAVAVQERAVSPPGLPHELYPGEGFTEAPWREIAWTDATFPKGQESHVVLFVNHADADAYCHWLQTKNAKYEFRLPTSMETMEWRDPTATVNRRINERDSAFPRPAQGPGAVRIFERFWVAPWTTELFNLKSATFDSAPNLKKSYIDSLAPGGRYMPVVVGSIGTPTLVPATFRVVAVKKAS